MTDALDRSGVLGLDPGSKHAGYALAFFRGEEVVDLELGRWSVPARLGRAEGLAWLLDHCQEWLAIHRPVVAAVETPFHHRNARSVLVLAEARGVLLASLGRAGVAVHEYSPAVVKKTICGAGGADKEQVRRALAMTVRGLRRFAIDSAPLDATDALALAVTHHVHARLGTAGGR